MLSNLTSILKKYDKSVWILYNDDSSDYIFNKYFFEGLNTKTFCIVSQHKIYLLVSSLDKDNLKKIKYKDEYKKMLETYVYDSSETLINILEEIISNLHFPVDISLSYSTMSDKAVDILSHGAYVNLTSLLKKVYKKYSKKVKFSSSEKIIYELVCGKTDLQIKRLKYLANITNGILKETFSKISVGMTEIEIVKLTQDITKEVMGNIILKEKDMVDFDVAWEDCPIVLTGENLAKGGHSLPSDKKLKYGDTIYFDFGIKVKYKDGEVLYTDMQRMGYAKKSNSDKVPKSVMRVFNTLVNSIESGIEEMKPGVKAYTIDSIVRRKIIKAGYPDYNHATGHAVGLNVHDLGAVISLRKSKRAKLNLVENAVYTIEPRINIANGGSIEEMILVTKYGGVSLCETQKTLYIVGENE